jgi:hypothetical protein
MVAEGTGLTGGGTVQEGAKSASVPNPQTLVLNLNGPRPRFHYNFIAGIVFDGLRIVPRHI